MQSVAQEGADFSLAVFKAVVVSLPGEKEALVQSYISQSILGSLTNLKYGSAPCSVLVWSLLNFSEGKTEHSATWVFANHAAKTTTLSTSKIRVVLPIRCRETAACGNDDYRIGLIFCFFSIKGKEKKKTFCSSKHLVLLFVLTGDCIFVRPNAIKKLKINWVVNYNSSTGNPNRLALWSIIFLIFSAFSFGQSWLNSSNKCVTPPSACNKV